MDGGGRAETPVSLVSPHILPQRTSSQTQGNSSESCQNGAPNTPSSFPGNIWKRKDQSAGHSFPFVWGVPETRHSLKSVNLDKICTISWVKNLQASSPLAAHALLSASVRKSQVATHAPLELVHNGCPPQRRRKFEAALMITRPT